MFEGIGDIGYAFADNVGGLVLANESGEAQRYDSLGNPLWGSAPIIYQIDPDNSYFENFWGDNNGGIIATFWTTSHGLSVQHTGRYGQPGIVPVTEPEKALPLGFELGQNYPNPFNPLTHIEFGLSHRSDVRLKLYNILGREIATLVDQIVAPGRWSAEWDATGFPSGVYFYRLQLDGDRVQTKKMMILR